MGERLRLTHVLFASILFFGSFPSSSVFSSLSFFLLFFIVSYLLYIRLTSTTTVLSITLHHRIECLDLSLIQIYGLIQIALKFVKHTNLMG